MSGIFLNLNKPKQMKTTTHEYKNPQWWTDEHETSWDRVKQAMQRDWDQTKHDFGGDEPDTDQDVNNTVKQAAGKEAIPPRQVPTYEDVEPAYRLGYGARKQYGRKYPKWNDDVEAHLQKEWETIAPSGRQTWMQDRAAIRRGWEYDEEQ